MRVLKFLTIFLIFNSCANNESSCVPIVCLNGGQSIECECECPEGLTGEDCSIRLDPKTLVISEIKLFKFPLLNNGLAWDPTNNQTTSLPDVYVFLNDMNDNEIFNGNTYYENADYTKNSFIFTPNTPLEIPIDNGQELIKFLIYDYDSGTSDDYMGGFLFKKYEQDKSFLKVYEFESETIKVAFTISFKW